ncbi:MAG: TetR/AcrR family transcriptional regulator [Segniliparus sp.]|uniref:TetR/AcrR family transcriptional regulator n=1 Tax=Segniliparus sp. TaxID=2804064 RepID=UPI003F2DB329
MIADNPKPSRSRLDVTARREQLLEIGCQMLRDTPCDQLKLQDVADRAGVSAGLIYRYFGSKQTFLLTLLEREVDAVLAAIDLEAEAPLATKVSSAIASYIDCVLANRNAHLAIHRGDFGADPVVRALIEKNHSALQRRMLAMLQAEGVEATPKQRFAVSACITYAINLVLDWVQGPVIGKDELQDLCAQSIVAILIAASSPARPG